MTEENLKGGQPNSLHNVPNLVSDEERTAFNPNSRGMTRNNPQLTYLQSHPTEHAKFAHDVENEDDKRPPNIEKCKIHKKAKKVYARGLESDKSSVPGQKPVCSCCGNEYGPHLRKLGLCCSRSDFYHLGAGFPLYFEFIIFCSLLICIMMIISGIYNVVTNNDDHDCAANIGLERKDRTFCDLNWITRLSLVNKRYSVTELEISNWLNLGTIAVMMIAFHFYRRQTILTIQEVDNSQQTPSDYTIMIKNLPLDATDEEIKTFFEKEVFFEKQVQIAKIVRGFNIGDFIKLQRRKNAIFYELGKDEVKNRQKLEAELEDVKKRLDVLEKNCNTQLEHSPFAFITFEEEGDAREALRRLGFSSVFKKILFYLGCYGCFSDLKFRGRDKLNVHRAPEPSDVIWENLGTSDSDQRKRRFISLIVSIILILITGGIIIAINVGKSKLTNPTDIENTNQQQTRGFGTEVISVVISLVIMFINNSLNFSTRVFASYESRSTYTSYFVSVARRLSLCTFINTAITLLVTNYILDTLWKNGGLLNDVVVVYVINAGVGPLLNILNPWYFYRLYRRRQIAMQGDKCPLTQKEANLVFEGPPVDMAQMYAMAVKTLWTTAFFAPVLPISIPIPLINMLLAFWVDKYLLLRRNAKPTELSKGLCVWMTEFLELTPFIFAAGNIIFRSMIINNDITNTDVSVLPSILCLALGAAFVLFPVNPLAKLCFKSEDNEGFKKSTYTQMRVQFNNDYDIANPVYHDEALESWLNAVEQAEIQQNNQNNPKAEMLKQIVQQEINPGQLAEADKNIQLLRNLKAYAKRMKGLEVGAHNNNRPQGPNQAMMFYKVDPNAAKIGNFIMHPKLHVPNQTNFNPQAQFGVNAASTTQPGAVQLNFERNPTLNQQQNVPQNQPYQPRPMGYPGPQYQPQGPAPQYNPQLQGQGMPPRYMQGPGQGQPFVPPQGGPQGYYPAPQMQQQHPMNIQMVPMNNNQPMGQPMNYGPGYQNYQNQGFQGQFPQN